MSNEARLYNDSVQGARSNVITKKGQAPGLSYINENGAKSIVRFDGYDGIFLIDRKRAVFTSKKTEQQAIRQSNALMQNSIKGRWEVPCEAEARRASKFLSRLEIKNIEVKVVPE